MKKPIAIILTAVILLTACVFSASANAQTVRLKVSGTTVRSQNKKLLKELNELRGEMDAPKLKMDKELTEAAYKRASNLAIAYGKKNVCVESEELTKLFVIAKGDLENALDKVEASLFDEDEDLNACGIANLTVKGTVYWVVCFGEKDKIDTLSSYSGSKEKYSFTAEYYISALSVRMHYGEFKYKTLRVGKKAYGRVSLNNGYLLKNSEKNFPVIYTSYNPEVATVNSYGKVTAVKPSYFKPKSRYTPKKGDFILFHWYKNDGYLANHVGIVWGVKSGKVVTIEGNTGTNSYRTSRVSKRKYSLKSSDIVGYIDTSTELGRTKAKALANLAKKQIGNKGKRYYGGTKAWKKFLGGKYMADNWCAIFCGWLMEQKNVDPELLCWSPSCTAWIRQCNEKATAQISARFAGTENEFIYEVAVTV